MRKRALSHQRLRIFPGNLQKLEGRAVRLPRALLPAFDRVGADVQQPREPRLARVQRQPNALDLIGCEPLGRIRNLGYAQVDGLPSLIAQRAFQRGFQVSKDFRKYPFDSRYTMSHG